MIEYELQMLSLDGTQWKRVYGPYRRKRDAIQEMNYPYAYSSVPLRVVKTTSTIEVRTDSGRKIGLQPKSVTVVNPLEYWIGESVEVCGDC